MSRLRLSVLIAAIFGLLVGGEVHAQDEEEPESRPALDLTVRGVGMGFGHVPVVHGLRFNYRDYEFQRVTGLNFTVWRVFENPPRGTVNGLALGMPATVAGRIRGVGVGIFSVDAAEEAWGGTASILSTVGGGGGITLGGLVATFDDRYTGVGIGGLGSWGTSMRGIMLSGIGAGVDDRMTGITIAGLGAGAGGTMTGILAGGLGAGVGESMRGVQIGGLGAGAMDTVYGVSIGGLGAGASSSYGVIMGGLGAGTGTAAHGVTLGGLGVVSGAMYGVQAGGLGLVAERVRGVQGAGIALVGSRIGGVTAASVVMGEAVTGIAVAPAYFRIIDSDEGNGIIGSGEDTQPRFTGLSASIHNDVRGHQRGISIGIYNYARQLSGVQIGVLNFARNNPIPFRILPLINVNL